VLNDSIRGNFSFLSKKSICISRRNMKKQTDAFAVQAHLASSWVSSGVFSTGLVPAVNVWHRVDMVAAGQADNTAGGSLQAAVADMAKLHAMSTGEVIVTGFD